MRVQVPPPAREQLWISLKAVLSSKQNIACQMTQADQKKIIEELRYYSRSMVREDLEVFEMFLKREKDGEDLDRVSEQRLLELYDRYKPKKSKKDADELWKKLTSRGNSDEKPQ